MSVWCCINLCVWMTRVLSYSSSVCLCVCVCVCVCVSVLSRLFLGVLHPPIVQKYPPISVSEAAAPPIRMMACKANLYSILLPNSYTHASTQQSIAQ